MGELDWLIARERTYKIPMQGKTRHAGPMASAVFVIVPAPGRVDRHQIFWRQSGLDGRSVALEVFQRTIRAGRTGSCRAVARGKPFVQVWCWITRFPLVCALGVRACG